MKLNLVAVFVFTAGFVLVYAGIRDVDPRDVVKAALSGENPADLPPIGGASTDASGGDTGGVTLLPTARRNPRGRAARGNTDVPNPDEQDFTPDTGRTVNV